MSTDPRFLDVEDDDQRQRRIGTLLERLNASSSSSVSPNPLLNVGHECVPGPVKPPSELLARVKAFLPAISASNEVLSHQKPEDIDIENVPENVEQYIEMNLGLGVFEARSRARPGSRPASPSSETESEPMSDASSSESESDSESSHSSSEEDSDYSSASAKGDSDQDSDADSRPQPQIDIMMKPVSSRPMKPLPRAKIEV